MTDAVVVSFKQKKKKRPAPTAATPSDANAAGTAAAEGSAAAAADAPASGFRKRSRRRADDSDTEENGGDDAVLQSIEQVLEDQRLRREIKLVESASASGSKRASESAGASSSAAGQTQYGLHDPKKDGSAGQKLLHLLDGQFTGQSTTTQKDQHEELMNKYIEEKLGKRRAANDAVATDAADDPLAKLRSEEDALYALPEHLKPEVPAASLGAGDESGNGGVLLWSAGIAEVELPESFKQKTAAATKRALERERVKTARASVSSALPTNFSTNFNRQRRDYVAELKSLNKDEKRERGFRTVGKHQSSDDIAVARFRKFEARRKFK